MDNIKNLFTEKEKVRKEISKLKQPEYMDKHTPDNRIYILQKDCLDAKAGDTYSYSEGNEDYCNDNRECAVDYLSPKIVENNPEWFKSKQQPVVRKVEVVHFHKENSLFDKESNKTMGALYYFNTFNVEIPTDKYEAVEKAIENVLNNTHTVTEGFTCSNTVGEDIPTLAHQKFNTAMDEFNQLKQCNKNTVEIVEKYNSELLEIEKSKMPTNKPQDTIQNKEVGYKILKCKLNDNEPHDYIPNLCLGSNKKYPVCEIWQVLRKSDNSVFTVGDKIGWGVEGSYESTLTGFEIQDGKLKFYDAKLREGRKPCNFLDAYNLHKILPQPESKEQEKPLEFIWFVNYYWELHCKVKGTHHSADNDNNIEFESEELGRQYILENKPCLSLSEVKRLTGGRILWGDEQSLIKAIKLKQTTNNV
jgi:hypothetical protein